MEFNKIQNEQIPRIENGTAYALTNLPFLSTTNVHNTKKKACYL